MNTSNTWSLKKFCENCSEHLTITVSTLTKARLRSCPLPYSSEMNETIRFYTYCPNCGVCIEVDAAEIPENVQKEVPFAE